MQFLKSNIKTIITFFSISISIYFMLVYELDIRAITIITFLLGYITNTFVGLIAIIELIPVIGPLIIKLFSIPLLGLINGVGYFTSFYAIKKGHGKEILNHKLITIVLLIGVLLGYILGHLIPIL